MIEMYPVRLLHRHALLHRADASRAVRSVVTRLASPLPAWPDHRPPALPPACRGVSSAANSRPRLAIRALDRARQTARCMTKKWDATSSNALAQHSLPPLSASLSGSREPRTCRRRCEGSCRALPVLSAPVPSSGCSLTWDGSGCAGYSDVNNCLSTGLQMLYEHGAVREVSRCEVDARTCGRIRQTASRAVSWSDG